MHISNSPLCQQHSLCLFDNSAEVGGPPHGATGGISHLPRTHHQHPGNAARQSQSPRHRCYCSALFMKAGGGARDGSYGGSSSSISAGWVAVEGTGAPGEAAVNMLPEAQEEDVPNTVDYNGETLTFGDYRRPSLLARCLLTLAAVGPVAWKALFAFRNARRVWSKVAVALVAPGIAWIVRSFLAYFHRETFLQPNLRPAETVAFSNSRFEDIDGLKVHYLREDEEGKDLSTAVAGPRCVLHMNHGFGASSSSWSPVIRELSRGLGALAIAHDTPGFGLTARVGLLEANRYSLRSNAAITSDLVQRAIEELGESAKVTQRRFILMGHSMGCITAATAALDPSLSPQHTTLVLVAPALSLPASFKEKTAEQQRASARRQAAMAAADDADGAEGAAAAAAAAAAGLDDELLRGGVAGAGATYSPSRSRRAGTGGVVRAVVGAPASAANAVLDAGVWVFNWCLLPVIYPLEILALRALVYRGNFWRTALRKAWVDEAGVTLDVINRYRWPSLVRYWDRGFALFLLDRLQIGRGGRAGPSRLLEAVAAKAAQGMKVIVVQGEKDDIVSTSKAKAIADAVPGAELVLLPECGHVPHEERAEDFLRLLLEQLSEEGAGDATITPDDDQPAAAGSEQE